MIVMMFKCSVGRTIRQRFQYFLILSVGRCPLRMPVLPRAEFVHHEHDSFVATELGDLLVDVGESLLELSPQPAFRKLRTHQFLAEFFWAVLGTIFFRRAFVLLFEEKFDPGLLSLGGFLVVPMVSQFGRSNLDLCIQARAQMLLGFLGFVPQTLASGCQRRRIAPMPRSENATGNHLVLESAPA